MLERSSMVGLLIGAIIIGFAPILVKLIDLGPTQIAVFRCGLAALILAPIFLLYCFRARRNGFKIIEKRALMWLSIASLSFAADLFCWHRCLVFLGAGLGTIMANTQSLYLALFGIILFRESLSLRFFVSLTLGIAGIVALVGEIPPWVAPENYLPGLFYGLLTGFFYSIFILALREAEKIKLGWKSLEKQAVLCVITTLLLIPVSYYSGEWEIPSKISGFWAFLLALGPQVIGWYLISSNLPKMSVSMSGLILLTQPVIAIVLGSIIFQETLTPVQFMGAWATLASLWLAQTKSNKVSSQT